MKTTMALRAAALLSISLPAAAKMVRDRAKLRAEAERAYCLDAQAL